MTDLVRVEPDDRSGGAVAVVRLDRAPMNVLNREMQDGLRAAAEQVGLDASVRAVVVYGGERTFAAGADVKEFHAQGLAEMTARAQRLSDSLAALAAVPKPVVAAVTGYALGGGMEVALSADVRFCAVDAVLGQPEILLGLIPGGGGTQRLSRLVGPARAKDIVFTGRRVTAEEALAIGLVDRVCPADEVLSVALDWARQFASGPALALRAAKTAIDGGLETDLASGLRIESQLFANLFGTEDKQTGIQSFLDHGPGRATFAGR